jgi:hypothetical protein
MNRKLSKITMAGLILALILTLAAGTASALPPLACDPAYVTQAGSDITVKPTGVDDTANLQCAFDAAAAAGPGTNVRLVEGTYHTAQIVVNDFNGQFSGAGVEKTLVLPLADLFVTWETIRSIHPRQKTGTRSCSSSSTGIIPSRISPFASSERSPPRDGR